MKFPKVIYVRMELEKGDPLYLIADESLAAVLVDDGPTVVGTYKLVETVTAKKIIQAVPRGR